MAKQKRELLKDDDHSVETKAVVNLGGQPTKYKPEYARTAQFLAQRGATQNEIADCFGVTTRILQNWLVSHPELQAAVQAGNELIGFDLFGIALLARAVEEHYGVTRFHHLTAVGFATCLSRAQRY
jgi:hypothetical protein